MRTTETVIDVDETIPELPAKDVIFRIYRDTRFSKDPTPYKVRSHGSVRIPHVDAFVTIASFLCRLVPHWSQRPLRLLLCSLRAGEGLHRRWHMGPGR